MLYAVSEIVFFLLVATLLGIGVGWWMARSERISVVAAMDRSGAHAAADRELAEARGEIEQLTAMLAVATEAIRELEHEGTPEESTAEDTETTTETDPIAVFPEIPEPPAEPPAVEPPAVEPIDPGADVLAAPPIIDAPPEVEREDAPEDTPVDDDPGSDANILRASKDRGGKRLSARVAEASAFSRRDRSAPTIKFDSED